MIDDPLHWQGADSQSAWTTVNISEALPDVPTPLTWTFFRRGIDDAFFGGFHALGALSTKELKTTRAPDQQSCGIFYGHPALNVSLFRAMAARMPMTSGDAMEEQLFGRVRVGGSGEDTRRRYPVVAAKLPFAMATAPRRLRRAYESVGRWRTEVNSRPIAASEAQSVLAEAFGRFCAAFQLHTLGTMTAQGQYDQLKKLASDAGEPGLEARLVSGYGSLVELDLIRDISRLAQDELTTDDFLVLHGHHGPFESELSSPSWRENPAPVEVLRERYREVTGTRGPPESFDRARLARLDAESLLLSRISRARRPQAVLVLRLARVYIPCRELGKGTFLQAVDVARAAARVLGHDLAARGVLAEPDDVFFLTIEELLGDLPRSTKDIVSRRRDYRESHRSLDVPEVWEGMPQTTAVESRSSSSDLVITGVPVSNGTVEGVAVVVEDPGDVDDFPPDAILVCQATDPSWAPLFFQCAAVVIDVGGQLSHGAIVARELGIPCVINTRDAVRRIRTGDSIRVDGNAGSVELLKPLEGRDLG